MPHPPPRREPRGSLSFYAPYALDLQLRDYCIAQGVPLGAVLVEALERHLAAVVTDPPPKERKSLQAVGDVT